MEQVANVVKSEMVRDWRIVLPVFLVSIIACIDRVNLAYAKLTMTADLPWITPEVFGMGAGIFFVGYLIFPRSGSLVASHFLRNEMDCAHHVHLGPRLHLHTS